MAPMKVVTMGGVPLELDPSEDPESWALRGPDGSIWAWITGPVLNGCVFTDTDGVSYIHSPLGTARRDLISAEDLLSLARHVFPDEKFELISGDRRQILRFESALWAYHIGREHLRHLRSSYKHPQRSKTVTSFSGVVEGVYESLLELGLTEAQADLAIELAKSELHPRLIWETVRTIEA